MGKVVMHTHLCHFRL